MARTDHHINWYTDLLHRIAAKEIVSFMKKATAFILLGLVLFACDEDNLPTSERDAYREDVITYFKDVALGFEFGSATKVTRKWRDDVSIFIGGSPSAAAKAELDRIIAEINLLTTADDFTVSLTTDTLESNSYLFFGSADDFVKAVPYASEDVGGNFGLFYVNFDSDDFIYSSVIYVDIFRASEQAAQFHLLREELTQSLGLARDSELYDKSIFQQRWTTVNEYASIDRDLIKILYNPAMEPGLDEGEVEPVLEKLVVDLKIGGN